MGEQTTYAMIRIYKEYVAWLALDTYRDTHPDTQTRRLHRACPRAQTVAIDLACVSLSS